ncbi:hypothetical protein K474DRAFT_1574405, partial [Panus rudis PR-1116 ss-1]
AAAPFHDPIDADVIICTSDNVLFYTHSLILTFASPYFTELLSRLEAGENKGPLLGKGSKSITVNWDSQTLDYVLRLCYPFDDPSPGTLTEVTDALAAATEYKMQKATKRLEELFARFAEKESFQAFAAACHRGLEEQARLAARA